MFQPDPQVSTPDFGYAAQWLNIDRPLSLADLRGRIILLNFWSYCSIDSLGLLSSLRRLEKRFRDRLTVIGVHSGKYPYERDPASLKQSLARYGVRHPVINDSDFSIWKSFGVRNWPTAVLLDPEGRISGYISSGAGYDLLSRDITRLAHEWDSKIRPSTFKSGPGRRRASRLSYPAGIALSQPGDRVFVADTNHNRIILLDRDGQIVDIIGSGIQSRRDGTFEQASFCRPVGLAADDQHLYVADTGNHLIRRCSLSRRIVSTVGGTGEQERRQGVTRFQKAVLTRLSAPWHLLLIGKNLFVSMPSLNQVWLLDLLALEIGTFAGSGHFGKMDGPLQKASFARPTGLASDDLNLYVSDSESSSIRVMPLDPDGSVATVMGLDLFDFGDRDGSVEEARLQHPMGLAYRDGRLFVADTYNNRIKAVDGAPGRRVSTLAGGGRPGSLDQTPTSFNAPEALAAVGNELWIADTNNHAIRIVDPASGSVRTLELRPRG